MCVLFNVMSMLSLCNDEPTENYHLTLQVPGVALWSCFGFAACFERQMFSEKRINLCCMCSDKQLFMNSAPIFLYHLIITFVSVVFSSWLHCPQVAKKSFHAGLKVKKCK